MSEFNPVDLAQAAASVPSVALVIAAPLALVIAAFRQAPASAGGVPAAPLLYRREHRALRIAAATLMLLFVGESVLHGYVFDNPDGIEWWRYAFPELVASTGLVVVASLIALHGTRAPEIRAASLMRREWWGFGPRRALIGLGSVALAATTTAVLAGLASSPDSRGRYVMLWVAVPNTTVAPIGARFFGWAYGVPMLLALAGLVVVVWIVLRANALRAFRRPETIAAERRERARVAAAVVHIALAGVLLSLAGSWRLISLAGQSSELRTMGESRTYDITWRFSEFAMLAGWSAPILEVVAFVLLLLVAFRPRRGAAGEPAFAAFDTPRAVVA